MTYLQLRMDSARYSVFCLSGCRWLVYDQPGLKFTRTKLDMQLLLEFWWSTWFTVEVKVVDVTLARKARFSTGVLSAGGFVSGGGGPGALGPFLVHRDMLPIEGLQSSKGKYFSF